MIHEIIIEEKEDKQVLVTLYDRIYIEQAAELRTRLLSFIERGHTNFVVDFNNVDTIDCSGLGTLVAIHKKAMHLGGGISIKGLHGVSKDLFVLTRLDKVFTMQ